MPRLTASLPKYRKHRASGQAVVTIAGKDHYLGPHNTKASRIEYDRLIGEWLAAGRPSTPAAPQHQITVSELIAKFWSANAQRYTKHGRETKAADNYRRVLRALKERYGRTLAIEFGPLSLKAMRAVFVERGSSRSTCNDCALMTRKVFRWGASEQLIPAAVPDALMCVAGLRKGETQAAEPVPVLPVDDATVDATLPHLSPVVADMVRLQRLTGARPGEICSLRPGDVDRTGDVWKYTPAEHKTEHFERDRVIFLGPKAQAILAPYLLRPADAFCFSPAESEKKRRAVLTENRTTPLSCGNKPGTNKKRKPDTRPGNRYETAAYRRAICRGCEIAFGMPPALRNPRQQKGGDGKPLDEVQVRHLQDLARQWRAKHVWTPHQLRHSAATEIRHKFGLESVQVVLGHAHARMSERYAEKNQELAAQVAREVG